MFRFDPDTYNNDLALLRLNQSVEWSENIRPICLPESVEETYQGITIKETITFHLTSIVTQGDTGWVTGWGRLYAGGPFPPVMKELDLPIIANADCEKEFLAAGYRERISESMMCAGWSDGRKDTCDGDSGGRAGVSIRSNIWKKKSWFSAMLQITIFLSIIIALFAFKILTHEPRLGPLAVLRDTGVRYELAGEATRSTHQ